MQNKYLIKC